MGFIRWIIGFLIAALVTGFAVLNRQDVPVFWSVSAESHEFPLYLICLGFMAAGFFLGALMVWMYGAGIRREKRKQKKQIKNLEKALDAVNENTGHQGPSSDFFPALPKKNG